MALIGKPRQIGNFGKGIIRGFNEYNRLVYPKCSIVLAPKERLSKYLENSLET
jgi:hypothetical protein